VGETVLAQKPVTDRLGRPAFPRRHAMNRRFWVGMMVGVALTWGVTALAQRLASEKVVQAQVLVDNPKVKMVRWVLQPGEGSPVHAHNLDHIYVVVRGAKIREITGDGKVHDDDQETGRAAFSPARGKIHSFANIGETPYEMVSIELK
jgi:quercetin dioxygenase-like cupin family protein